MTITEYTKKKQIDRQLGLNTNGLHTIYKAMSDSLKQKLKSHVKTIQWNTDVSDCKDIHDKYNLSWNEIRFIIDRFCRDEMEKEF